MGAIDWSGVPIKAIRAVFRTVVRRVPLPSLTAGARGEIDGLLGVARADVACTERIRVELAYEAATGRPYPYRCGKQPPEQGAN